MRLRLKFLDRIIRPAYSKFIDELLLIPSPYKANGSTWQEWTAGVGARVMTGVATTRDLEKVVERATERKRRRL